MRDVLVLLVVACGTTYTRPDTTAEQLNSDLEECKAIARGDVDLTSSLGRDDLMSVSGMRKKILPGTSTCFLYLNGDSPRLGDARVRRAIGHSIDRETKGRGQFLLNRRRHGRVDPGCDVRGSSD